MGCCCGKSSVREAPNSRDPLRPQQALYTSVPPPVYRPPPTSNRCDICSLVVDAALIDSHRETCRANHKRAIRTAQQESNATRDAMNGVSPQVKSASPPTSTIPPLAESSATELTEEETCVVCIEYARVYAFVPCGHLAVCRQCAPQLDSCPVCRGPREGLLFVEKTDKLCVCKHCKHVIGPTFFDAHREVCALRMRQNKEQEASPEALEAEKKLCVHCRQRPKDRAFLPCGHFMYCASCAAEVTECPQCCVAVKSTMPMFEA